MPLRIAVPIVLVLSALPVVHVFANEFVWDDVPVIVAGDVIHDPGNLPAVFAHHTLYVTGPREMMPLDTYRPVTLATFFWDSAISGRDPWSYHLTNLLAHLSCTLLVLLLARRLLAAERKWLAPFVALWFGVSPWLGEAHVWINGRSDLFATAFGLGAILVWLRGLEVASAQRRFGHFALASALFFLGLLSKETLLLAVPAIALIPSSPNGQRSLRRRLAESSGLLIAVAGYIALRLHVLGGARTHHDVAQLWLAAQRVPVLLLDGLRVLLVPSPPFIRSLNEAYAGLSTWALAACGLLVAVIAFGVWRLRRQAPLLAWGFLWYCITLAPAALIATMSWGGFGRYLYLPAVGVVIGVTDGTARLLDRTRLPDYPRARRLALMGMGGYIAALAAVLGLSVLDYRDQQTLFRRMIDRAPNHALGYSYLAGDLRSRGAITESIPLLERAVELDPGSPRYSVNLAEALLGVGRVDEARRIALASLDRVPPDRAAQFHSIAIGSYHSSDPERATQHLLTCLAHQPEHPDCRRWASLLLSSHPLAARYRELVARALAAPEHAQLRQLVDTLRGGP